MTFSESYVFVFVISLLLSIPLGLAIRTLLATKEHVILPILRLRIRKSPSLAMPNQCFIPTWTVAANEVHLVNQGGNHGDRRSVDGQKLSEH